MKNISYLCNKKFMFTLYHIPDRKEWGCTKNLKGRLKKLGYTLDDVYETLKVEDIDKAANLEKELNIMYGYGWNPSKDYRRVTKIGLVGAKKGGKHRNPNGGKIAGKIAVESGHLAMIREARKRPILQYHTDGTFIKEWGSGVEAANALNLNNGNMTRACQGKQKTCGGFVFKYKLIL